MSIILNALRQQGKTADSNSEVHWAHNSSKRRLNIPWRGLLIGILVFSLGFGSVMFSASWIQSRVVNKLPAPTQPPIHPAQEPIKPEVQAAQAFERGDFAASIGFYHQAIANNPNDWALLNNLGLALTKVSKLDEAESVFFKAIALNTQCASCYNNLGDLEFKRDAFDEAELYYQKAAKSDPTDPAPYFNLGVLYEKKGDPDAAFEAYSQFLDRTPHQQSEIAQKVKGRLKSLEIGD